MEVNIVIAKCCKHNQTFGLRLEKINNNWLRTWAFKIKESSVKREGYDKNPINGTLMPMPSYPGCPYCKADNVVLCGCGKVSCYLSESKSVYCYWCNTKHDQIMLADSFSITPSKEF